MRLCQVVTLSGCSVDMSEVVSVVTLSGCSVDTSKVVSVVVLVRYIEVSRYLQKFDTNT